MLTFRFPVQSGDQKIIGAFSYATGKNIGGSGVRHIADFSSKSLDQSSFTMTVQDNIFNSGDTVSFRFSDADGNVVIVDNAVIQQSSGRLTGGEDRLEGLITASGKDQNGDDIAAIVDFNENTAINDRGSFYSDDTSISGSAGQDVAIDPAINVLYIGN